MTCRGMKLDSDIDQVICEEIEAKLKKYMLTKNCKKETALRLALQRATNQAERDLIQKVFDSHVASQEGLI